MKCVVPVIVYLDIVVLLVYYRASDFPRSQKSNNFNPVIISIQWKTNDNVHCFLSIYCDFI